MYFGLHTSRAKSLKAYRENSTFRRRAQKVSLPLGFRFLFLFSNFFVRKALITGFANSYVTTETGSHYAALGSVLWPVLLIPRIWGKKIHCVLTIMEIRVG